MMVAPPTPACVQPGPVAPNCEMLLFSPTPALPPSASFLMPTVIETVAYTATVGVVTSQISIATSVMSGDATATAIAGGPYCQISLSMLVKRFTETVLFTCWR